MKIKRMWEAISELMVQRGVREETKLELPERPPADADFNDRVLANLRDDDPILRALTAHAYDVAETNFSMALDINLPAGQRQALTDRGAGILQFLQQVEGTRARLREAAQRQAKREEKKQ